jgi:predicted metal-dependent hydrolase
MSSRTTPADVTVPARDIRFDLSSAKTGHWLGGDPVGTAVFNALSLTFPDGERMFMDAVKNYRKDLTGKLAEDVRGFIAQEAIHSREHLHLNMLIDRERYPVAEIEAAVKERTAMARDRGPFICQSQSLNLFVADPTYSKLSSMHFYAWKQGLKTGCYYLRTKAAAKAQQFTVEPSACVSCSA